MLAPLFKKAALFAFGFLVFGITNILRITTIVSIGYWLGEEIAMLLFHTITGWLLILIGMLFILFVIERFWNVQIFQSSQEQQTCSMCNTSSQTFATFCSNCGRFLSSARSKISSKFWAKLILLLLGSYLVTLSIQAPTFAVAKGVIEVSSNSSWENATNVFPEIPDYQLKFLYRDENYEKIAGQDASLLYAYLPTNMSNPTVYVDLGVAKTISNLHNWEVCLIAWQTSQGRYPLVSVLDSRDNQLLEDVPIIARYLVFETPANHTQVTLYWYEKATFNTGLTVEQRYVRISLIILTLNSTMYPQFENELLTFGQSIASHWKPLKSQSLISIGIPMQQAILGLAIAFVTVTKTAEHTNKWRKKSNNLRIFNNFASPNEKLVLQTIQQLTKEKKVVQTKLLTSALAKAENPIKYNNLIDILSQLEKYGLIKKDIASIRGKPILVWKS
jgi:exosortase/archaeosortase family protein